VNKIFVPIVWGKIKFESRENFVVPVYCIDVGGFRNPSRLNERLWNSVYLVNPESIGKSLLEFFPILFRVGFVITNEDNI
jgi:hypothetical protein